MGRIIIQGQPAEIPEQGVTVTELRADGSIPLNRAVYRISPDGQNQLINRADDRVMPGDELAHHPLWRNG